MPSSYIPIGTKVKMKAIGLPGTIKGVKFAEGVFKADEFDERLHNGGGRGSNGYYWFVSDESLEPYDLPRKKTGFAKFIGKIEKND